MDKKELRALFARLVEQQGNITAAAATLGVNPATLWRWRNSSRPVPSVALVAIRAVLAHPEDYTEFRNLARPAHRPPGVNPGQ